MIEVDVKDYCQNCEHLDPKAVAMRLNPETVITRIICSRRYICADVAEVIDKHREKANA